MSAYNPDKQITITYETLISVCADAARECVAAEQTLLVGALEQYLQHQVNAHANRRFIGGLEAALEVLRFTIQEEAA